MILASMSDINSGIINDVFEAVWNPFRAFQSIAPWCGDIDKISSLHLNVLVCIAFVPRPMERAAVRGLTRHGYS